MKKYKIQNRSQKNSHSCVPLSNCARCSLATKNLTAAMLGWIRVLFSNLVFLYSWISSRVFILKVFDDTATFVVNLQEWLEEGRKTYPSSFYSAIKPVVVKSETWTFQIKFFVKPNLHQRKQRRTIIDYSFVIWTVAQD